MSFQIFPEGCNKWAISYLEGERVPERRCVMTGGIGKMFVWFVNSVVKGGDVK